MKIEIITARTNPKIQFAASLKDKKNRKEQGMFYFEGRKLFIEAVRNGVPLTTVFATEKNLDFVNEHLKGNSCTLYGVSEGVYDKLSEEKSPEGIFCLAKTIDKYHNFATIYIPEKNEENKKQPRMMLCSLRDPGNLGTIVRSAAAFGCTELILSEDCADIYNSKTVRASMGMLFHTKITVVKDPVDAIRSLQSHHVKVYAAALHHNSLSLFDVKDAGSACFVIGNEGHGLDENVICACDGSVIIPMMEGTESLNASIAASVLLYVL